jgi:hypothetical protein
MTDDDIDTTGFNAFAYRGHAFLCGARKDGPDTFMPVTLRLSDGGGQTTLPEDTDAYGTEAEAIRHAEQQAMRWVNDRTGDGQGQF